MSGISVIILIVLLPIIVIFILLLDPVLRVLALCIIIAVAIPMVLNRISRKKEWKRSVTEYFNSCDDLSSKKYPRKEDLEFLSTLLEKDLDGRVFLKEIGFDLHYDPKDDVQSYDPSEIRMQVYRHQIAKRLVEKLGMDNLKKNKSAV